MQQEPHLGPGPGLVLSVALHVAAFFVIASIAPPEPEEMDLVEFEVARLPPEPEPEEPEPEAPEPEEPEPEPEEPEPEPIEKPEPKPAPKPRPKPRDEPPPKQTEEPAEPPPPRRIELPPDQTIPASSSGVTVNTGSETRPGRTVGEREGSPRGERGAKGSEKGTPQGRDEGPPWAPKGDLYIAQQPRVVRVPEIRCPAVRELGISGTVVLEVQVRRDGSVRKVRVSRGIGHGCDTIAAKALRKSKFKPAIATDGKATDYALRYEYVFEYRR